MNDGIAAFREDEVALHKVDDFESPREFLREIMREVCFSQYTRERILIRNYRVSKIIRVE
jgi:hypothetical protein